MGPLPAPLLSKEDALLIDGQLSRIVTNLNQIAKRLNAEMNEGELAKLEAFYEEFTTLTNYVAGIYGCR